MFINGTQGHGDPREGGKVGWGGTILTECCQRPPSPQPLGTACPPHSTTTTTTASHSGHVHMPSCCCCCCVDVVAGGGGGVATTFHSNHHHHHHRGTCIQATAVMFICHHVDVVGGGVATTFHSNHNPPPPPPPRHMHTSHSGHVHMPSC